MAGWMRTYVDMGINFVNDEIQMETHPNVAKNEMQETLMVI